MLPTIDLSLSQSLLLPQLSLPFSQLQPKEAKRHALVPILLYRSTSTKYNLPDFLNTEGLLCTIFFSCSGTVGGVVRGVD